jgi:hypothetical protein
MAEWVYVENNEIMEYYGDLPANWRHISGLSLSKNDLPFLKSLGWYPVTKESEIYDSSTQKLVGYNYTIRDADVLETPDIVDIPLEELTPTTEYRDNCLAVIRLNREKLLKECDWTQLPDVQNTKSAEWIQSWASYRQQLRDLPQTAIETDNFNVEWPVAPEN